VPRWRHTVKDRGVARQRDRGENALRRQSRSAFGHQPFQVRAVRRRDRIRAQAVNHNEQYQRFCHGIIYAVLYELLSRFLISNLGIMLLCVNIGLKRLLL